MKKILVINTKYREFGGEDANITEELKFLNEYYHVEYLEFDNSRRFNFYDIVNIFSLSNRKSNNQLSSKIASFNPDIAYIHNTWFKAGLGIFKILKKENIKILLKIHNFRYLCSKSILASNHKGQKEFCMRCGFSGKLLNKYYKESYLKSLYLIFYNRKYLKILKKQNMTILVLNKFHKASMENIGIPADKIKTFFNPISFIEKNNFTYNKKSNYVVYAGRLTKEKGVSELLKTWSDCSFAKYSLRVIGDGELLHHLKDQYKLQNIIFYGSLTNEETLNHIKGARGVITATKMFEGQPRLLNEAAAFGIPSIFPQFGGISEYYPSNYPLSFEQYNYEDLKNKLMKLNDEKLLTSVSGDVLKFTKSLLSTEKLFQKFEELTL